jgi:hypothetical protein
LELSEAPDVGPEPSWLRRPAVLYVLAIDDGSGRTTTKEFVAEGEVGERVVGRLIEQEIIKYSSLARYTMSVIYEEGSQEGR